MTSDAVSNPSYADTLWKSADALRGQVDAAEYKHVVLGLLCRRGSVEVGPA